MTLSDLSQNPWLLALPADARSELLRVAKIRTIKEGQLLHGKHDDAIGLYGVLSGEIRASATTFAGEEIVFTRIEPGQWFGELAILDGGDRTHDAHATTDTTIAFLPRTPLLRISGKYPSVYTALVKLLCEHCRMAFSAIDDFLLYPPTQRLAKRVLSQLEHQATNKVQISQEELGALVGISRQSANKILKSWEQRGWIKRIYRGLEVLSPDSLHDLI